MEKSPRWFYILARLMPLVLLSVQVGLSSCQNKKSGPSAPLETIDVGSRKEIDLLFDLAEVDCGQATDCPESVAALFKAERIELSDPRYSQDSQWNFGACSSVLVSKNLLLTNRHCIPDEIIEGKESCSENIIIKFPKVGTRPVESAKCKQVVDSAKEYVKVSQPDPDWALIELDRSVDRQIPSMNFRGLSNHTKMVGYPVYYQNKSKKIDGKDFRYPRGVIQRNNCQTMMNSFFADNYRHENSSIVVASCDRSIQRGNSGSPYYIGGELVALSSYAFYHKMLNIGPLSKQVGNNVSLGFNLSCYPVGREDELSPFCKYQRNEVTEKLGNFSYWLQSLIPNDQITSDMLKIVDTDPNIKWKVFDSDFFEQAIEANKNQLKFALKDFAHESENYTVSQLNKSFPYVPDCIYPELKDHSPVVLKLPFYEPLYFQATMSDYSVIETPIEIRYLSYEFNFDKSNQSFEGKLVRTPPKDRSTVVIKSREYQAKLRECLQDGPREFEFSHPCNDANNLDQELRQIKVDLGFEFSWYDAESWLLKYPEMESLAVPVCDSI